jgi:hypothetical protein
MAHSHLESIVQLHSKQNPNKAPLINGLSLYLLPNQGVFQKSVKFSTTQTLEMFNLKQPKPLRRLLPWYVSKRITTF